MNHRLLLKNLIFLLIVSTLVFLSISFWRSAFGGWLTLIIYLLFVARGARLVLIKFFNFSARAFRIRILSIFSALASLGWLLSLALLFLPLTALVITIIFFLNGFVYFILGYWAGGAKKNEAEIDNLGLEVLEEAPRAKVGVFFYVLLVIYGFFLLYASRTGQAIVTPWQTIGPKFLYVFFLSTLFLGFLIFSKLKTKTLLFLLVVHSFLLHSYLPLTHDLLYGADQWRHIAAESQIASEKSSEMVVYGGSNSFLNKLNPGRLSYGQEWGIEVALSRLLSVPLFNVNKWSLPVIWSVILPILLFELARIIGFAKKQSLFFVWLGFLPFAWQAGGSFSLPVNLGFLVWLLSIILVLKRIKLARKEQLAVLALVALGSIFGYVLYFILFLMGWGAAELIVLLRVGDGQNKLDDSALTKSFHPWMRLGTAAVTILMMLIIPLVELVAGYSRLGKISLLGHIKQLAGNFFAYYLASGPRPHDIITGNIIFNQVPSYAFVSNIFTQWRWWMILFMIVLLAAALMGIVMFCRRRELEYRWLAMMSVSVVVSYIVSLYFLTGEHVLSRRLDNTMALFLLLPVFYVWINFVFNKSYQTIKLILSVLVFSLAIVASYSLGPDTSSVSANQYAAVSYIWQQEKDYSKHCVLADTYPLLALEAVSAKEIVGGGFPISQYFAQPERVALLAQMNKNINNKMLIEVFHFTKAEHCWFVGEKSVFQNQNLLNAGGYNLFGDTAVLRYNNVGL